MSFPEKLLEKAFYWSPLLIGVVSLIIGVVLVEIVESRDGEVPLAHLKFKERPAPPKDSSIKLAGETKAERSLSPKERQSASLKEKPLRDEGKAASQKSEKLDSKLSARTTKVPDAALKKPVIAKLTSPPQARTRTRFKSWETFCW